MDLRSHSDKKQMQVYELVPTKGGVKVVKSDPADPQDIVKWNGRFAGLKRVPKELSSLGGTAYQGEVPLDQFAGYLSSQMDRPVVDGTGLRGRYLIDFFWPMESSPPVAGADDRRLSAQAATPASDRTTALVMVLQKYLGLQLQRANVPIDLIVVDSIAKAPTAN
jgi:uncharacterized protein (TIGR03435 family)